MTIRIAMWSGPRNISTAMMRSWENRPDCSVIDEPFYAHYLVASGKTHPMQESILAAQSHNYDHVACMLSQGKCETPLQYQKHMTQHMLPGVNLDWAKSLRHCFLIRDPVEIVASFNRAMPQMDAHDIGIVRQLQLYQELSQLTGQDIPVIDSNQVLADPRGTLTSLCEHLQVPFTPAMLAWPAGKRESDGVWAPHWYARVEQSTGFSLPTSQRPHLTSQQQNIVDKVLPAYECLAAKVKKY